MTAPSSPLPSTTENSGSSDYNNKQLSSAARRTSRSKSVSSTERISTATEAKLALLHWVRLQLEDYVKASIIPVIQDFSRSWKTGAAFCLLIHRHDPDLIPELFDTYLRSSEWNKQTWRKLLETAFSIADTKMSIPRYLEPEDLLDVDYPHEPSVMMYVSEYYKVMSAVQRSATEDDKAALATKRNACITALVDYFGKELTAANLTMTASIAPTPEEIGTLETVENLHDALDDTRFEISETEEVDARDLSIHSVPETVNSSSNIVDDGSCDSELLTAAHALENFLVTSKGILESICRDETYTVATVSQQLVAVDAISEQTEDFEPKLVRIRSLRDQLKSEEIKENQFQSFAKVDELEEKWKEHVEHLESTHQRLLAIQADLAEGEQDAKRYRQAAATLEKEMIALRHSIDHTHPTVTRESTEAGEESHVVYILHPLDGSHQAADTYEQSVSQVSKQVEEFENSKWKLFESLKNELCEAAKRIVANQENRLVRQHSDLLDALSNTRRRCARFKRGVSFAEVARALNEELEVVRRTMNDTTQTMTGDAINDMEARVNMVHTTIVALQEEYQDLLDAPTTDDAETDIHQGRPFTQHLRKVQEKYEMVRDWVNQVRVWFIEAERIRKWIDERIDLIETRNEATSEVDPLSPELVLSDDQIVRLHEEHETLREEVERFDADDMTRLRAHVKALTVAEREKDLSPADTATIEITLTTLNMLGHLMQLLRHRSMMLNMLLCRMQWENLFADAVGWVAATDEEITEFLHSSARWNEKQESNIEEIVNTLVGLERKIAEFDQGAYSRVLEAYQEIEDLETQGLSKSKYRLSDHLEKREDGFEKAFEDLMKRCGFCRKVVEQHLAVLDAVKQFQQLREHGEQLRETLIEANEKQDSVTFEKEQMHTDRVQEFKERSAYVISHYAANVPYPQVPEMVTAIGAGDEQVNQAANESVRSAISAFSMSLALIADGLDQLLATFQQALSLQQRAKIAYDEMSRVIAWMEERIRTFNKSHIDLFAEDGVREMDEEGYQRLEKERDSIAVHLSQVEHEDLASLLQYVQQLEDDVDASNMVSFDRGSLISCVEKLEATHQQLQGLLDQRAQELNALKKLMAWQSQWTKTNQWILTIARKLWDFSIKRARYDPAREDVENPSYAADSENTQMLATLQDRVTEIGNRQIIPLTESHEDLIESLQSLAQGPDSQPPQYVMDKQAELEQKYRDLQHLATYASELMTQRSTLTEFLLRAQDAQREGEKIKDGVTKITRRIMEGQEAHQYESRVEAFSQEIDKIRQECCDSMIFPVYGGSSILRSLQPTETASYAAQLKTQVQSLMDRRMGDLRALQRTIDRLMDGYKRANHMKMLLSQYNAEAAELKKWIDEQISMLKQQHLDVAADTDFFGGMTDENIDELHNKRVDLIKNLEEFENVNVRTLNDKIGELVEKSVQNKMNSLDVVIVARSLGEVVTRLDQLKEELKGHDTMLKAVSERVIWERKLHEGLSQLEAMNEKLRQFNADKSRLLAQDDFSWQDLEALEKEWQSLNEQKQQFDAHTFPEIQEAYDRFVDYFALLARPIATPDHIEARMESFERAASRLQENLTAPLKELQFLRQLLELDEKVQKLLKWFSEHEASLEEFIEHQARWRPDAEVKEDDEVTLQDACSSYNTAFVEQDASANKLTKEINQLSEKAALHSIAYLSEALSKRVQDLKIVQDRLQDDLQFANKVVMQRCTMAAFMLRTEQLEQSAEMIREEIVTSREEHQDQTSPSSCSLRLERFRTGVDDVRESLAASIPYPTRVSTGVASQKLLKDETTNSVVRDTVDTRINRLEEIYADLERLLESKEILSRQKIALQNFKKEVETCSAWIRSHQDMLNQALQYKDSKDVLKLRDGVRLAESIEAAMTAKDSPLVILERTHERCLQIFRGEISDETVEASRQFCKDQWEDLARCAADCKRILNDALLPAEIELRAGKLLAAFQDLKSNLEILDAFEVTDEQISEWQKEVDKMEGEYGQLQADVMKVTSSNAKEYLERIEDSACDVRTRLAYLYDAVNMSKLQKTHAENAEAVLEQIQAVNAMLHETIEKYESVAPAEHIDSLQPQQRHLLAIHKSIKAQIADIKEAYNDLCAYYEFITGQISGCEFEEPVRSRQASAENEWEKLQASSSKLSQLLERTTAWMELYASLKQLHEDLRQIETALESERVENDEELRAMEAKTDTIMRTLEDLKKDGEKMEDSANRAVFEQRQAEVVAVGQELHAKLKQKSLLRRRSTVLNSLNEHSRRIIADCAEQSDLIYKLESRNNNVIAQQGSEFLDEVVEKEKTVLDVARKKYDSYKDEYEGIFSQQCQELVDNLQGSETEVAQLKDRTQEALDKLGDAIRDHTAFMEYLKLCLRHACQVSEIRKSLEEVEGAISKTGDEDVDASTELVRRCETLEDHVQNAGKAAARAKQQVQDDGKCGLQAISCAMMARQQAIEKDYAKLLSTVKEYQIQAENARRYRSAMTKVCDTLRHVDGLKDRAKALQLAPGKSMVTVQRQEMYELEKEAGQISCKDIDDLLSRVSVDTPLQRKRQELDTRLHELKDLLQLRQEEAAAEGNISKFMSIIRQLEEQATLLADAVESAAPHNASVVDGKFSKTDLQGLLRSLVASYKQYEPVMTRLVVEAKNESQKHDGDERVKDILSKTLARCNKVKSSAAARERELQTCINQLDHEFFTKLAMAKTKQLNQRNRAGAEKRPPLPASVPMSQRTSSQSGTAIGNANITRRTRAPSTTGNRPSKTPVPSRTASKATPYIPDPKNELDVELGRIVNETPYRVKVKMVPGEVGKYWFGDVNPRLVYCRILPSKLVMVRVGGGWVELSK